MKMRQFDPDATLDRLDDLGQLTTRHVDAIAAALAEFHGKVETAPSRSSFGNAESIWAPQEQNLSQLASRIAGAEGQDLA